MSLKKWFQRSADSFDDVKKMVTRKLPIPDLGGTEKFIEFRAQRDREGYWSITSKTNISTVTAGVQAVARAYQDALVKHTGRKPDGDEFKMNFDSAFLVLRDMEDSLIRYSNALPEPEPERHFMAAYRLLPPAFRQGLDELLEERTAALGELLPPRAKPAAGSKDDAPRPTGRPKIN